MHNQLPIGLAFAGFLTLTSGQAYSQTGHAHHSPQSTQAAASPPVSGAHHSAGVVRRVNAATGTVTIAHGPLTHLDMPPMTMGFQVAGNASLDGLSTGDKVRFVAGKEGSRLVVTWIEKVPQ